MAILVPQVVLTAVLTVGLGALPLSLESAQTGPPDRGPLRKGDCVRQQPDRVQFYVSTPCEDARAEGRVLAVIAGHAPATESCVEETDFFATRPGEVLCLRRTGDRHPGDPGMGGGVYRRGDCVATDAASGLNEVPCDSPTVFETVVGRVESVGECRPPAVRYARLARGARTVLCLGDGPGMAGPGECMGDPQRAPVTFDAIPCSDSAARAEVLARVASPATCRSMAKQTHYVKDPSGLPQSAIVCIRALT